MWPEPRATVYARPSARTRAAWPVRRMGYTWGMGTLLWLDAADSTQDELLRRLAAADGAARPGHGDGVGTADQRAGRGRHGRAWQAPPGAALALSVHLRPTGPSGPLASAHLSWLSLVASAAVARRLVGLGVPAHLKWPNDVLDAEGRKLCGVLATLAPAPFFPGADAGETPGVVVGMGVNVDLSSGRPVPTAAALTDHLPGAEVPAPRDLAQALLRDVAAAADRLARDLDGVVEPVDGTHPALAEVAAVLSTPGRRIRAELPGGEVLEGVATGLGAGGVLAVRVVTGERETITREISAGDVVHLRGDVRRGG